MFGDVACRVSFDIDGVLSDVACRVYTLGRWERGGGDEVMR